MSPKALSTLRERRRFRQAWRRMLILQYLEMVQGSATSIQRLADRYQETRRCVQQDLAALRAEGERIDFSPAPGGGVMLR